MKPEYPTRDHIPQLRALWKAAFGDDDAYLDLFFSTAFSPLRSRCILEDNTVLAALYWFDVSCDGFSMAYLYAVATNPAARNRGLCRTLIEDTKALLAGQGYAGVLLKAADSGLREMYARMGFFPCTAISRQTVCAWGAPAMLNQIGSAEYARLRREYLPAHSVLQEDAFLDFLAGQADFYHTGHSLAAVSVYENEFCCHELLGDIHTAPGLLRALSFEEGTFFFPGNDEPYASLCPLNADCPVPAYFGLSLG